MDSAGFKVGDKVQWSSQAAGHTKTKEGIVARIVPVGTEPWKIINGSELEPMSRQFDGTSRNHESCLVVVTGPRGGKNLYWPRVSSLKLVV